MSGKKIFISLPVAFVALALAAGPTAANDMPDTPQRRLPGGEVIEVGHGGGGCPAAGRTVAIPSPDGRRVTVLFDRYSARARGAAGRDRQTCNLAVSMRVPAGYRVVPRRVDYWVCADIPPGGHGQLRAEYFFPGETGPVYTRQLGTGCYVLSDDSGESLRSGCGQDVILRANTSIIVRGATPRPVDRASITVEGIIMYLDYQPC